MAAAAANAVLDRLTKDGLVERSKMIGERLKTALHAQFDDHPHVGDIRGRGLFIGLEIVADRDSKDPFDPNQKKSTHSSNRRLSTWAL